MNPSAFLFDLDGTLYVGEEAVPGAVETLRELVRRDVPRRFITNTTRRSRRELAQWLAGKGFPITEEELFTAPVSAAGWLAGQGIRRIALYVPETAREDFTAFEQVEHGAEAVIVGDLGRGWDFATLDRAFRQLMEGARLVALHKNRYWLTPDGLSLDAGPFVAALEYATGKDAEVVGKPSAAFFREAVAALGQPPERVAVVGDDLESDVAGAQGAGLQGFLVRTGKFRQDRLEASTVRPDRLLDSVADLLASA